MFAAELCRRRCWVTSFPIPQKVSFVSSSPTVYYTRCATTMPKPSSWPLTTFASALSPDINDDPLDDVLRQRAALERSRRLWRGLFVIAMLLCSISFAAMALMAKFSHNTTFANDFVSWTFGQRPPTSSPEALVIPSICELNRGKPVLPIHSHNDYWRKEPLFEALALGIQSVEADVWAVKGEDALFVGHSWRSLRTDKTLKRMYTGPIEALLQSVNNGTTDKTGMFDSAPNATLYLYIDVKNRPTRVFELLQKHLQPLQKFMTTYDVEQQIWTMGSLTVILSGNYPVDLVAGMKFRNVFIDAPLDDFAKLEDELRLIGNNETLSSLAIMSSAALKAITGTKGRTPTGLTSREKEAIRNAIKIARSLGIKTRIWDTPAWPVEQRDQVWRDELALGVDMINADHLQGAAGL